MIQNIWNKIEIYCGCHGDDHTIKMMPHAAAENMKGGETSIFYSCPKYYPENRNPAEIACFNRLSIAEYEGMVQQLCSKLENNDVFALVNLSGYTWKNKNGTIFHVLEHTNNHIKVLVVNKKSIRV